MHISTEDVKMDDNGAFYYIINDEKWYVTPFSETREGYYETLHHYQLLYNKEKDETEWIEIWK